jgi:hypothetical protein
MGQADEGELRGRRILVRVQGGSATLPLDEDELNVSAETFPMRI